MILEIMIECMIKIITSIELRSRNLIPGCSKSKWIISILSLDIAADNGGYKFKLFNDNQVRTNWVYKHMTNRIIS